MTGPLRLDQICLRLARDDEHVRLQEQWFGNAKTGGLAAPVVILNPIVTESYEELLAGFAASPQAHLLTYYNTQYRDWTSVDGQRLTPKAIAGIESRMLANTHPGAILGLFFVPADGVKEPDFRKRIRVNFIRRPTGIFSYQILAPSKTKRNFQWIEDAWLPAPRFHALYDYDLTATDDRKTYLKPV